MGSGGGGKWRRVADALIPNITNYEHGADCDGSVSFVGDVGPLIMFGPGCGYHGGTKPMAVGNTVGDAAVVGLALAADPGDARLLRWNKSERNPLVFSNDSQPCSFAGQVWHNGDHWNLVCSVGGRWGRYIANSARGVPIEEQLHGPWKLADPSFAGNLGGASGPTFLPLPTPKLGEPTHVISDGARASYSLGRYSTDEEKFVANSSFVIDHGAFHWTAGGVAQSDGRVLVIGWVGAGKDPKGFDPRCPHVQGISVCGIQLVSCIRVLSYEAYTAPSCLSCEGVRTATKRHSLSTRRPCAARQPVTYVTAAKGNRIGNGLLLTAGIATVTVSCHSGSDRPHCCR